MPKFHSQKTYLILSTALAGLVFSTGGAFAQACPDWQVGGATLTTDAETAWSAQSFDVQAGGSLNNAACNSNPGVGFVQPAPNFTISYDARSMGRDLDFRVVAPNCDSVLLVNDAAGQWQFNDDADGSLNSRLRLAGAQSGTYNVWVGTYNGQSCNAQLIVETFPATPGGAPATTPGTGSTGACPTWNLGQNILEFTGGQSTQSREVQAGGSLDLNSSAAACGVGDAYGRIDAAPDLSVHYSAGTGGDMVVRVTSACDSTLLANDYYQQWHFNDDTDGLNPALRISAPVTGRYDFWVGTFAGDTCPATITVSTEGAGSGTATPTPTAATCPAWQLGQNLVELGHGGSVNRSVTAGGPVNLHQSAAACEVNPGHGFVNAAPEVTLNYQAPQADAELRIAVNATCDTVLLVNDLYARWQFNDDATDLNPVVTIPNAEAGRYDIWVGTYNDASCQADLQISSIAPGAAPAQEGTAPSK